MNSYVANIASDPQVRARFRREAQVMARFGHPNAVAVFNAEIDDDIAYIEMEYIRGQSLDKLVERGKPMPLDCVGRLLRQLCDVLQVAHENSIVHRDLKLSNLMLLEGRRPGQEHLKVLDFGIAKILGIEGSIGGEVTRKDSFLGTPPYASPEQADGEADERSDIYSVGVILYELLTGHRPFSGSPANLILATRRNPPPPFLEVNPEVRVPREIEKLVLRCLAKDPAQRPQSARELAELFERALPTIPYPVPPVPKPPWSVPGWLLVVLVLLTVAIMALVIVRKDWLRGKKPPSAAPGPGADAVADANGPRVVDGMQLKGRFYPELVIVDYEDNPPIEYSFDPGGDDISFTWKEDGIHSPIGIAFLPPKAATPESCRGIDLSGFSDIAIEFEIKLDETSGESLPLHVSVGGWDFSDQDKDSLPKRELVEIIATNRFQPISIKFPSASAAELKHVHQVLALMVRDVVGNKKYTIRIKDLRIVGQHKSR